MTAAAAPVAPERKRGATQYDADQDKGQGDVQQGPEPGERGRKAGEEQHQREDQPDVVRLPDRADGLGDELALPLLTWTAGEKVPDATAKIRPSEQRVGVEGHENDHGQHVRERHVPLPAPRSPLPDRM